LIGLLAVSLTGCVGAYKVAPVAPGVAAGLTPTTADPDAGLVTIAPGSDLRPYTVLLVERFEVSPKDLKDAEDFSRRS